MESIFIIPTVIAVVELLRRLQESDYFAAVSIVAAAVVGGLASVLGFEAVSIGEGIVLGLSASGVITSLSKVG